MTAKTTSNEEPVRLLFEMTRDDNPRLYDDLIRFNKGTKRVNRLRLLAHEGLNAQNWVLMPAASTATAMAVGSARTELMGDPANAWHTNQAFDAPPVSGAD